MSNEIEEGDECFKCGSTEKLQVVTLPHTYDEPSSIDVMCEKCSFSVEPEPEYSDSDYE